MGHRPTHLILVLRVGVAFLLATSVAIGKTKPRRAFLLPVTKNAATKLYYTSIHVGNRNSEKSNNTSPFSVDLAVDLGGRTLWFNCDGFNSSTYLPFRCGTPKCQRASYDFCIDCDGPFPPGCSHYQCGKYVSTSLMVPVNTTSLLIDFFFTSQLGRDDVFFAVGSEAVRTPLILACGEDRASQSLPAGGTAVGAIGLANSTISVPSQLASRYRIPRKFALCFPSKAGRDVNLGGLYIGGGPYFTLPNYHKDVSKIFTSTPFVTNPVRDEFDKYFIDVKSIEINGKALSLNKTLLAIEPVFGNGGTKISTMAPYAVLHTSIYETLIKTFTAKAKMARAAAVAPFGACFSSKGLGGSPMGPAVPVIDLVLRSGVKWRIYGSNSLVKVKRDIVCLGFVDGGENPGASIVIGGHQLEDNLVEFDFGSSKLSFTSSLLLHNISCSHF